MEFVGRSVKKEANNGVVISGVVRSFNSGSGLFVIEYKNGDSETLEFSELGSTLVEEAAGERVVGERPKRGRKPKRRRGGNQKVKWEGYAGIGGEAANLSDGGGGNEGNLVVERVETLGNLVGGAGGSVRNGSLRGGIEVDLNEGFGFEDGCDLAGNGEGSGDRGLGVNGVEGSGDRDGGVNDVDGSSHKIVGFYVVDGSGGRLGGIDLNVDASAEVEESSRTRDRGFDLNLGFEDEEMKDVEPVEETKENEVRECVDAEEVILGNGVGDGTLVDVKVDVIEDRFLASDVMQVRGSPKENSGTDADLTDVAVRVLDTKCDNDDRTPEIRMKDSLMGGNEAVADTQDGDMGSSYKKGMSRSKKRKILDSARQGETVLRRSTRRTSVQNKAVTTNSSAIDDVSSSPSVSALTEEKQNLVASAEEEPEDSDVTPPKLDLPPSSTNLNIDKASVMDLFYVYACLRSFSTILFLSPFELEDFVAAVNCTSSSMLFDSIHVSIFQALRKHLERISDEGSKSASNCLRNLNWCLLDLITWPVFLVEYLLTYGSDLRLCVNLSQLNLFRNDYYRQPASVKVEVLRCLCDSVMEAEAFRSELNKRSVSADTDTELDSEVKFELLKKRRVKKDASSSSCLDEYAADTSDGNSDECCLCKMDGNLICCDGCPAAYHSKCVGVANHLLPEGEWFCPECELERRQPWMNSRKALRGAEVLGTDPHGRRYYGSCGYLLVSDSCDADSSVSYYNRNDVNTVIEFLRSSHKPYHELLMSICKHWNLPLSANGVSLNWNVQNQVVASDMKERMSSNAPTVHISSSELDALRNEAKEETRVNEDSSLQFANAASGYLAPEASQSVNPLNNVTKATSPYVSSEGSAETIQASSGFQSSTKAGEGNSKGSTEPHQKHEVPVKSLSISSCRSSKRKCSKTVGPHKTTTLDLGKEDTSLVYCGIDYVNRYSFAQVASCVAEELASKTSVRVNVDCMKTEEEIISTQMKAISRNSTKFCWPNNLDMTIDVQREKCGWCFNCRNPNEDRNCLCSVTLGSSCKGSSTETAGLLHRNMRGHLIDVLSGIIYIEDRLRGLLTGPWLNPHHSKLWRKSLLRGSTLTSLKRILLMLEANMNTRALSLEWFKYVDSEVAVGSACHIVISSLRRKRTRVSDSESNTSGLGIYWWRGSQLSRQLFSWKKLPHRLASKAARQGGCTKIPGILYNEGSEYAKRSKSVAWRAAVETSSSAEQLALQVRELGLNIRWDDIENTHILGNLDKEARKSVRLFKKAIVRKKCTEGDMVKYLLDFGKRRGIPIVVMKNGTPVDEPSSERKKYWLGESYLPLHLLKTYEDKRIARKTSTTEPGKQLEVGGQMKKSVRKRGFSYLFSKAERSEYYQCGHCNKDVKIREAVSCQSCGGFFHKRHARKSGGAIPSECTYTCHQCQEGRFVNNADSKRKRSVANRKKVNRKGNKVQSQNCQKASEGTKPLRSKSTRKATGAKQLQSQSTKNVPASICLRRSARRVKLVSVQHNIIAEGKQGKKKGKKSKTKKRTTKKPRKVASSQKKTTPVSQKKRTPVYPSYWFNGLFLSRKPKDDRAINFREKRVLIPTEHVSTIVDPPSCHLCGEAGYKFTLIGCETCGDWYHGDAFGLDGSTISKLIGFRCHACRRRTPPVCPHQDALNLAEGQDDAEVGSIKEAASLEQELKQTVESNGLLCHEISRWSKLAEGNPDARVESIREVASLEQEVNQTVESKAHLHQEISSASKLAEGKIDAEVESFKEMTDAVPPLHNASLEQESNLIVENDILLCQDISTVELGPHQRFLSQSHLEEEADILPPSKKLKKDDAQNFDDCLKPDGIDKSCRNDAEEKPPK